MSSLLVLTKEIITGVTVGLLRIKGDPRFTNHPTNFGEVCVTIDAFITEEDAKKLSPQQQENENCNSDPNLTSQEREEHAKKDVVIEAVLNYDNNLSMLSEQDLLGLFKNRKYDGGFDPKTGSYCTKVTGEISPIEVQLLLLQK